MTAIDRANLSLEGLSVGDAFGDRYFVPTEVAERLIEARAERDGDAHSRQAGGPQPVWRYTDDTQMALSVVACLNLHGTIDQDWLVADFARLYESSRGYGSAMHAFLSLIRKGASWHGEAERLFEGQGSFGNGAAMRVAPVGGYFADNLTAVVEQAMLSAEVTHAHPEGIAGAVSVAVASAMAVRLRGSRPVPRDRDFLELIVPHVPDSEVREGIRRASNLASGASVRLAVSALGNGTRISAQDTVPFALWCAARHLDDYEEALWLTVAGLGDRDTTCAIVGGIVALNTGLEGIPEVWLTAGNRYRTRHLRFQSPFQPGHSSLLL